MGRAFGFLALIIVVGVGLYLYSKNAEGLTPAGTAPRTTVDVTGVQNDLLRLGNAERRYWAMNSKYASLDELRRSGDSPVPSRANYSYSSDVNDNGFTIIATYSGPDPKAPKHISVDETMSLKT